MYFRVGMSSRRQIWSFVKYLLLPLLGLLFIVINYITLSIILSDHWSKEHKILLSATTEKPLENIRTDCNAQKYSSTVWLRKKKNKNSTFTHIIKAFKAHHYNIISTNDTIKLSEDKWHVLWSHNYPFNKLRSFIMKLKKVHCINQYPGSGFITNKVYLVTSDFKFIPKAFKIPYDTDKLRDYGKDNPKAMFVQKSSDHRGIKIKKLENLNLGAENSFIQEFIHNPLLIDGYKFDIGVYVIITSVNPLRVYVFEGDVLFRFCKEKYHPFSADNPAKYVVGDDYLPTWKVPSLSELYLEQELGMKDSFDAWLRSNSKEPEKIWIKVKQYIKEIIAVKEEPLIKAVDNYPKNVRFFELMRFDFIITDQLEVFLMEANMSPNLSSAHFKQNRLLYEQVVFNMLAIAGVSNGLCASDVSQEDTEMRVALKDIVAFPDYCSRHCVVKGNDCEKTNCQLCNVCSSTEDKRNLKAAFLEHLSRGMSRRLIPAPIDPKYIKEPIDSVELSPENTLMAEWFRGKCLQDHTFCS